MMKPIMNRSRSYTLCMTLSLWMAVMVSAENWPQWRGPHLNGSTEETGLPSTWSKTQNIAWSLAMQGPSASTPIVWGDHVFV